MRSIEGRCRATYGCHSSNDPPPKETHAWDGGQFTLISFPLRANTHRLFASARPGFSSRPWPSFASSIDAVHREQGGNKKTSELPRRLSFRRETAMTLPGFEPGKWRSRAVPPQSADYRGVGVFRRGEGTSTRSPCRSVPSRPASNYDGGEQGGNVRPGKAGRKGVKDAMTS